MVAEAPGAEEAEDEQLPALQPFPRITRAAIEALRYRAEDIARSLTKTVIKEVSPHFDGDPEDCL